MPPKAPSLVPASLPHSPVCPPSAVPAQLPEVVPGATAPHPRHQQSRLEPPTMWNTDVSMGPLPLVPSQDSVLERSSSRQHMGIWGQVLALVGRAMDQVRPPQPGSPDHVYLATGKVNVTDETKKYRAANQSGRCCLGPIPARPCRDTLQRSPISPRLHFTSAKWRVRLAICSPVRRVRQQADTVAYRQARCGLTGTLGAEPTLPPVPPPSPILLRLQGPPPRPPPPSTNATHT
ncbi:hypothetical protein NN561_005879 [Cricetulus griseus]